MNARLVFVRLESRLSRALALTLALAAAVGLARLIVQPFVAGHLAVNATTVADLERALAWDPTDPALHLWLGHTYDEQGDLDHAQAHFEQALRLRPTDAYAVLQLALLAERRHETEAARAGVRKALALDPYNVVVRWEAALMFLRLGDRDHTLEHLRYVLAVDPSQRDAAFQLGRALLEPDEDTQILLPSEPQGLTAILAAAIDNDDLPLATVAWRRRTALAPPVPRDLARRYIERLLNDGQGLPARAAWLGLMGGATGADNAVWNGGFENERLLGWGFDWRIQRTWGVDVALDQFIAAGGRHSLRLTFNSFPTLDFAGVSQLVAVDPGREYHLEARAKASDFETQSGVKLEVLIPGASQPLAETNAIMGTTDWIALRATVRIPEGTSLVLLRAHRERTTAPEGNLGGKVWLDEVALQ